MAKFSLSTTAEEQSFFNDYFLIGIRSALKDYRFCWTLNRCLGLNLSRTPALDIHLFGAQGKKPLSNTLFDHYFEQENKPGTYYFSVYKEDLFFSECSYFLYNNRCEDQLLIPEKKEVDFFFLVPWSANVPSKEWLSLLADVKDIQWSKLIEINSLKSKINFIF